MPKAKYEGIYHSIKKRIEAQDYPYQSLLPSENTLIEEYACSRNTVRRALAELVADGYVQTMQGRGVSSSFSSRAVACSTVMRRLLVMICIPSVFSM